MSETQMEKVIEREAVMAGAHAEVGDYVRKDGGLVRIERVDKPKKEYCTSDGGCMGFDEVGHEDVLLESEIYGELLGEHRA